MKKLSILKLMFFKLLNDAISTSEFEKWIYNNTSIEKELGTDIYLDLISFDYSKKDAILFIKDIFKKRFKWLEYEQWKTINLLSDILNNKLELVLATRKMRELYLEQENTLNTPLLSINLAIGYESELDRCPLESEYHLYDKTILKKLLEPIDWYRDDILKKVELELEELKLLFD